MKYYQKIEQLQGVKLEERIQYAMNYKIKNEIQAMPYLGNIDQLCTYHSNELIALCPVTGILDLYSITIKIIPDKLIPELKSLKMYFLGYKDLPIGHEHIAAKIYKEIKNLIKPEYIELELDVAIRGGIKTKVVIKSG